MKRSATRRAVRGPARRRSLALGTILLAACVTAPVGERSAERTVAFQSYTVPAPEGDGWGVTRDPTKESVFYQSQKTTLLGKVVASTEILVFKVPFAEEGAAMSEEALAAGFLEREHRGMLELGVARNQYRLGEVKKAVETVGGKKLYTMRYSTEAPGPGASPIKGDAALFLYFPPDYAARRAFFGFLVQERWEAGSLAGNVASSGLGRIEPMIAGFTLRPVTPAAEPPPLPRPEAGHAGSAILECEGGGRGARDASGAWRDVRWGMTADEVVAAFPGEAVRASPEEIKKGSGPVRIDRCVIAGTNFHVSFFFRRASRLTQITLRASSERDAGRPLFERLAKMLTERYGPPTDQHDDVSLLGPLRQSDRAWKTADAHLALVYMHGTGEPYLSLVYDEPPRPAADER